MSKRNASVGSFVSVGGSNGNVFSNSPHGDYRWTGTVVDIKKGEKKGDYMFLVERAKGKAKGQRVWVIDKDVRLYRPGPGRRRYSNGIR